ncbi:MAG: hypothetical protein IIY16_07135 [Oscillospiraceae bacterium]|nr:hypothetical protein [Oscillospiraceae bacterium]
MNGGHPDVLFVDGGDKPRSFGVDLVRMVRSDARIRPNEADRKVYILAQAHNMTEQAQNALLKILEEPPGYAVFLLTCESAQQLLPTVRSRAVTISLGGVGEADALRACALLCPNIPQAQMKDAFRMFDGNIGQMASSLTDGNVLRAQALCDAMLDAIPVSSETALLKAAAPLIGDRGLCRAVCALLRTRFIAGMAKDNEMGAHFTPTQCARCADALTDTLHALDRYANQHLTVTLLCTAIRQAVGK